MTIGPIVDGDQIARAAEDTLRKWMPSVLAEIRRRKNLAPQLVRAPVEWRRLSDEQIVGMDASQSPTIAVVTGPATDPKRDPDGRWSASWAVGTFVFVRGGSFEETHMLVHTYLSAIRTSLVQHDLEVPGAQRVRFTGEQAREVETDAARSVGFGVVEFAVRVGAIVDDDAGPAVPPEGPDYPDFPDGWVETAHVEVEPMP